MSAIRVLGFAAAAALVTAWGAPAGALTIDYQPLPDQSGPSITQSDGGSVPPPRGSAASRIRRTR